jgi:K+-sensing histidine kinase KdpD
MNAAQPMLVAEPQTDDVVSMTEEREREHRRLLSDVAHDLKTPLASIIGSLEAYERMRLSLPPEKQQALIRLALQEAYRLDGFIGNILTMAKLENGAVAVRREPAKIAAIVEGCLSRFQNRLGDCQVRLMADGKVGTPVVTDPALLGQAFGLLLDNAIKYAIVTSPTLDIHYGVEDRAAYIEVHDGGPGVPEGKLDAIFLKYVRLDDQDGVNARAGLGLAICREIMRLLDGTVTAVNRDEGGTAFALRFPSADVAAR